MSVLDKVYYADFETTSEINYNIDGYVKVYMWVLMSADGSYYREGEDLVHFMKALLDIAMGDEEGKISVWFHNLKFDFSFIEAHFLKYGGAKYKVRQDINMKYSFGREYITARDDMGNLYNAIWLLGDERFISFKDSAKVFATTIKSLGKSVGVDKLDEDFDYTQYISNSHVPTEKDWEYARNDVEILRLTMNKQILDAGCEKLTRAGYAFEALKQHYIKDNTPEEFKPKAYGLKRGETIFDYHFPATPPNQYQLLSRAYFGGMVYIQEATRDTEIGKGLALDVNSEYPAVMQVNDFPIGEGVRYEGMYENLNDYIRHDYPLYIQFFTAKFKLKSEGIPSLPKSWGIDKGVVRSSEDIDYFRMNNLALCNVDMEHFFINYDVEEINYEYGIMYHSTYAPFASFINKKAKQKIEAEESDDSVGRLMAKLDMNSCYGKFAQKPDRGSQDSVLVDGVVRYKLREEEVVAQQYFPMAIFIAAYARDTLFQGIYLAGVERVLYVDTDSIHIKGWSIPEGLEIHDTKLGAWSFDAKFTNAKFLRDKCYVEEVLNDDGTTYLDYKAAGLNDEAKATIKGISDFKLARSYSGVLTSRVVEGGILLVAGSKYLTPMAVANPNESEMARHNEYMSKRKAPL